MFVPLFRTLLLRSSQVANTSFRNVSRTVGVTNFSWGILPSHSVLARSRNLMTTSAVKAAAAETTSVKSASAAKPKTKGRTVGKKKPGSNKKPAAKKKPVKAKRKKAKKAVKPKKPRIYKKDWTPPFKRPLGSFAKFVTEFAKSRAGDQPIDFKEELLAASVEWKNMSDEQKAAYEAPASEKEEYRRRLAEWNAGLSRPVRQAKRRSNPHSSRPPLPLNPMSQFVKEQYHQTQFPADVTTTSNKMRYLANIYSNLSEAEKEALKEHAEEEFKKKKSASA